MQIQGREIGRHQAPFIIAEMSGNHQHSLDRALCIVREAAQAGAHALKIQTYTADTMTINLDEREFRIDDPNSPWAGRSLYALYQEAHLPWAWHQPIIEMANRCGLIVFSTPFDHTSVDFLESLETPCYKIASFENTDIALIRKVAATGKPMIISTGMASLDEIGNTVAEARSAGCRDLVLLKCTSSYPALPVDTNIATLVDLRRRFDCEAGLSDHTTGLGVAIASVALGASVIEKHFTLDRQDGGVDAAFSIEPHELKQLVVETERAWQALGSVHYGPTRAEHASLQFRRSLYIVKDLQAGDVLNSDNTRAIRPGLGLPTRHLDQVLGKRVNRVIVRGTPLAWEMLDAKLN